LATAAASGRLNKNRAQPAFHPGGSIMSRNKLTILAIMILVTFSATPEISRATTESDYTMFDPLVDVADLIEKYYVSETDQNELIIGALNGMLHKLDPYSEYIPAKDLQEFQKQVSGNYEGLGIGIDVQNGYLTVISPFEGSPAYQAGILPGDIILKVDDRSTEGWSGTYAVKELTGSAGTDVTLKILHRNGSEETINVTRRQVHVPTVRGWRCNTTSGTWQYMIDADRRIGYLRVIQFTDDTASNFDQAMTQLLCQNMQALIIDLRSNPGGLMPAAIDLVDRLIEHGVIVSTRGANSPVELQEAHQPGTYSYFHLVVLIDQGSASASEIVAGSLQDHNRAVIVGKRSWGKGSAQRIFKLPNSGDSVKLTTDYYYLPKGRCVHRLDNADSWGITPDIEAEIDPEDVSELRDLMRKLDQPPSPDDQTTEKQLAEKLLQLDDQLDQAVKQCIGLIRTKPAEQAVCETTTETGNN